jgi:hypothetical protein
MNTLTKALALAAFAAIGLTAKAVPLNFGTDLEASDTYLGTSYVSGNLGNTESEIADLVNGWLGTTYVAADIAKTDNPSETGAPDGQFYVGSGFDFVIVKYDGKNAGSALFWLGGSDAWIPFDSAPLWGTGDKYAVSHFAVVDGQQHEVPDAGTSIILIGLGLLGIAGFRRIRG